MPPIVDPLRGNLLPMLDLAVHTNQDTVWLPDPNRPGARREYPVCRGLGVAWTPVPEANIVLLYVIGGTPAFPTEEALACEVPISAIGTLIEDLQSIERQWAEMG